MLGTFQSWKLWFHKSTLLTKNKQKRHYTDIHCKLSIGFNVPLLTWSLLWIFNLRFALMLSMTSKYTSIIFLHVIKNPVKRPINVLPEEELLKLYKREVDFFLPFYRATIQISADVLVWFCVPKEWSQFHQLVASLFLNDFLLLPQMWYLYKG